MGVKIGGDYYRGLFFNKNPFQATVNLFSFCARWFVHLLFSLTLKGGMILLRLIALSKDEEEKVKNALLDFILRISSKRYAPPYLVELLPKISEILLNYFRF